MLYPELLYAIPEKTGKETYYANTQDMLKFLDSLKNYNNHISTLDDCKKFKLIEINQEENYALYEDDLVKESISSDDNPARRTHYTEQQKRYVVEYKNGKYCTSCVGVSGIILLYGIRIIK